MWLKKRRKRRRRSSFRSLGSSLEAHRSPSGRQAVSGCASRVAAGLRSVSTFFTSLVCLRNRDFERPIGSILEVTIGDPIFFFGDWIGLDFEEEEVDKGDRDLDFLLSWGDLVEILGFGSTKQEWLPWSRLDPGPRPRRGRWDQRCSRQMGVDPGRIPESSSPISWRSSKLRISIPMPTCSPNARRSMTRSPLLFLRIPFYVIFTPSMFLFFSFFLYMSMNCVCKVEFPSFL